ncbi:MAG: GDP-mannose 4,6-dehydratase [Phycisphaerae bacterium]|nr:GDP-mannose 4,6-dehydratase [Phycisphaerae bacterium]
MRALITGGAGFIGSHLAERLLADGQAVTVIDDLSTGRLTNLAGAMDHLSFQFVRDSVRNETVMTSLMRDADVVYHLAAAVGVRLIVEAPVHTIETNIHGSEVVLALANRFRVPTFLASTSEVYGKSNAVPFREDADVVYGSTGYSRWAYACSKVIDEFLGLAYHQEHALPVVIGRLFNVIGPRQTGAYGMVVPRFVTAALRNEPLHIHGTGEQTRCFCNVRDVVEAILPLPLNPQAAGEVFNIGATEEISMNQLADLIIEQTGGCSPKEHISYEAAFGRPFDDMMRRLPDTTKIHALTGWAPKISLADSVREVIDSLASGEG